MVKKLVITVLCGISVAVLSGCSSLRATNNLNNQALTSSQEETIAHINGTISGFYFLHVIPVWCGSQANVGQPVFFTNGVTLKNTVGMVTEKSKSLGGSKFVNMRSEYKIRPVVPLIPACLLGIKECQVSGNSVK